jgi:hypothetical protein
VLSFANFDPSVDLLVITIDNWTGTANTAGGPGTDRLIFNTSQSAANLALFEFNGYLPGAAQFNLGGGFFEVTPVIPVPETSTWVAAGLALAAVCFQQRSRYRRVFIPRAGRRLASGTRD